MKHSALLKATGLAAGILLASQLGQAVAADFELNIAPPAVIQEQVPPPRDGYTWAPGYWDYDGGKHAWRAGHWEQNHPGERWSNGGWTEHDGRWDLDRGHWDRDDHRNGDRDNDRNRN